MACTHVMKIAFMRNGLLWCLPILLRLMALQKRGSCHSKACTMFDPVHNREGVDGTCRQGQERTLACCVAAAKLAMLTGTPGPMVEDKAARMK